MKITQSFETPNKKGLLNYKAIYILHLTFSLSFWCFNEQICLKHNGNGFRINMVTMY